MAFATSALVLLTFWALVSALDALIRASWLGTRYEHWMTTHSVAVSPGHVRWTSTILNRAFLRAGHWRPRLLHIWFTAGLVFGLAGMVLSVVLLTSNLASMLRLLLFPAAAQQQQQQQQQVLQVIVPGVNLPLSQASYFFLAVLLSGVVHEFGHAVAAVKEQVRVNGFGCFLFVLYPGAFVELHTPHLQLASPSQQLRIFCAGVWHNFVLVVVAALALLLMPWALALFYRTGAGALVTAVVEDSGVGGGLGLRVGDVVTTVGECSVAGAARWAGCLVEEAARPPQGFCLSSAGLHLLLLQRPASVYRREDGSVECCRNGSETDLCFSYSYSSSNAKDYTTKYACLSVRRVLGESRACGSNADCRGAAAAAAAAAGGEGGGGGDAGALHDERLRPEIHLPLHTPASHAGNFLQVPGVAVGSAGAGELSPMLRPRRTVDPDGAAGAGADGARTRRLLGAAGWHRPAGRQRVPGDVDVGRRANVTGAAKGGGDDWAPRWRDVYRLACCTGGRGDDPDPDACCILGVCVSLSPRSRGFFLRFSHPHAGSNVRREYLAAVNFHAMSPLR
ncbi:membrane-bound transcription factor site-2 protease isoform X1 [Petromyzon marinus]|uniref:membrane-bound transcription factor site-2 protease isoform X1 n=1 Tax=Petromyzon marinus TaxID=7757 RepID=UPI003F719599